MILGTFVDLDALPLTPSGKVNRAALPEPHVGNILRDSTLVEPRTPIEKRMADILAALLDVGQVSVEDNFFLLGGHSSLYRNRSYQWAKGEKCCKSGLQNEARGLLVRTTNCSGRFKVKIASPCRNS